MEDIAKVNVAFRVHMTEDEAREFNFPENFYTGFVCPHMGIDPKGTDYKCDCTEISVSQELFDFWADLFQEKYGDSPEVRSEFNMAWLMCGPTTDEALHGLEVCASDKFITKEDN